MKQMPSEPYLLATAGASVASEPSPAPLAVAVIVPTFEEAGTIRTLIDRLTVVLAGTASEIVVVDDWSGDGTPECVEAIARERRDVRLIRRHRRRGLSSAVIEGMLATAAPVVAVIDGDLQHDETMLPHLLAAIATGADVAVGTRYAAGGSCRGWSTRRRRISRVATRLARCPNLSDPMSGFFAIRRDAVIDAVPHLSNLGFKILLDLLLSSPRPLAVREIAYRFRCRTTGQSKLDAAVAIDFALLLIDKRLGGLIPPAAIRALAIALSGFAAYAAALAIASAAGFGFATAQPIAAILALMVATLLAAGSRPRRDRRVWQALATGIAGAIAAVTIGVHLGADGSSGRLAGAVTAALWTVLVSGMAWRRS